MLEQMSAREAMKQGSSKAPTWDPPCKQTQHGCNLYAALCCCQHFGSVWQCPCLFFQGRTLIVAEGISLFEGSGYHQSMFCKFSNTFSSLPLSFFLVIFVNHTASFMMLPKGTQHKYKQSPLCAKL
jgi:hypothetical protein|uniref:Uncharacterized protein n=1 Tax=Eutreptiella gymnastica TaxID=73025 RepID=A0A7S4CSQ3_9EUGL